MELPQPTRLEFDRPASIVRPYAYHYRFCDSSPRAAVFYFGGAIGERVYEERRTSAPTPIAEAFARALSGRQPPVDLVICPCPLVTSLPESARRQPGLDAAEEWLTSHFDEIVQRLGRRPTSFACVGYSAGAAYATLLAAVEDARAAAVFGPAGVDRVIAHVHPLLAARREATGSPFDIAWLVNDDDANGLGAAAWQSRFPAVQFHRRSGEGGHPFVDYDANGSVTRSFAFVLDHL